MRSSRFRFNSKWLVVLLTAVLAGCDVETITTYHPATVKTTNLFSVSSVALTATGTIALTGDAGGSHVIRALNPDGSLRGEISFASATPMILPGPGGTILRFPTPFTSDKTVSLHNDRLEPIWYNFFSLTNVLAADVRPDGRVVLIDHRTTGHSSLVILDETGAVASRTTNEEMGIVESGVAFDGEAIYYNAGFSTSLNGYKLRKVNTSGVSVWGFLLIFPSDFTVHPLHGGGVLVRYGTNAIKVSADGQTSTDVSAEPRIADNYRLHPSGGYVYGDGTGIHLVDEYNSYTVLKTEALPGGVQAFSVAADGSIVVADAGTRRIRRLFW